MADVVFRLHLPHILSFLGLTTELSAVAPTSKLWAKVVSELFKKRDVIMDCFSTDVKYFDFRLQKWIDVNVVPEFTTKNPLAVLLIDDTVTAIDTFELNIKQFYPERNSWIQISNPSYQGQQHPPLLDQFACAYHDGYIYLVGGHHTVDDSPSSAVWRYSIKSQVWMECVALSTPFFVCSCAVLLESENRPCLTVIGSNVRNGTLTNEGVYIPISEILTGNWQSTAPVPDSIIRISSRSIVWSRHSIIVGMWMRPHKFTLVEFNLSKNSWEDPYPLPGSYYIFPAAINNQIVGLAVDSANRLVTLRYNRQQWHFKIHSQDTLNKFSLIMGVPFSSVTDR